MPAPAPRCGLDLDFSEVVGSNCHEPICWLPFISSRFVLEMILIGFGAQDRLDRLGQFGRNKVGPSLLRSVSQVRNLSKDCPCACDNPFRSITPQHPTEQGLASLLGNPVVEKVRFSQCDLIRDAIHDHGGSLSTAFRWWDRRDAIGFLLANASSCSLAVSIRHATSAYSTFHYPRSRSSDTGRGARGVPPTK
ncbi:hypothetical protein PG997_014229 [Apiospora hydei]|uniref:Uncharacterized protein n=1 Tax=Apiospora hydei TaxID=1337664 RepID=A0ABR1UT69_9PEZI